MLRPIKGLLMTFAVMMLAGLVFHTSSFAYTLKNDYTPNAFPAKVSDRVFSIALDPGTLLVVYPAAAETGVASMRQLLRDKCGADIPLFEGRIRSRRAIFGGMTSS